MGRITVLALLIAAGSLHAQSMNWVQETPASQWAERSGHATVSFQGKLWVLGGMVDGGITNDIWNSSDGVNWTEVPAVGQFSARFGHAATVFKDRIWVIGGTNGSFGVHNGDFNDVWSSPDGITWTLELRNGVWEGRSRHAVVVFNDRLWILGGFSQGGMWVFALDDVWSSTDGVNWMVATLAPGWVARWGLGAAVFNNRIWIAGGDDVSATLDDVWSSPDGTNWIQETPSAPWTPRFMHSMLAYNNRLWVIGNEANSASPSDVWSSSNGVAWTLESASPQWAPRGDNSSVVHAGKIWVLGGTSGLIRYNDVWSYGDAIPVINVERSALAVYDGGSDRLGGVSTAGQSYTWQIHNSGTQLLSLTGTPRVAVTPGTGAPVVNVTVQPAASVAPASMTTFQIEVHPNLGAFDFDVRIESNDPADNPFVFTARGVGSNSPELSMARGVATVAHNGTDALGGVSTHGEVYTWEVRNVGAQALALTGTPRVSVTPGAGAPAVNVLLQPPATLAPNSAAALAIEVIPSTFGPFEFTVSISSNDPTNSPFLFTVQGVGRAGAAWVEDTPAAPWSERSFHSAVAFDGQLWAMSGFDTVGVGSLNDIWSSPDGVNWTQAPATGHWSPRFSHSVTVFNNRLWVMGGRHSFAWFSDVWSSPDGVNWTLETASPGWSPRAGHAVTVFDNRMWIMGGEDDWMMPLNDIWSSTDGVNWTQVQVSGHWTPRMGPGVCVFNGRLWLTGGWDFYGPSYDVWSSADGATWTREATFAGWPARAFHGALVYNNRLWVIAGETFGLSNLADVWSSADGIHWVSEERSAPWNQPPHGSRMGAAAVVHSDRIWLLGGPGNDVWSYDELTPVPMPLMRVARNSTQIPNAGVDALGGVPVTGEIVTWEVANAGSLDLELTGTPRVAVIPGTGVPVVNVAVQPSSPVAPSGMTVFQIEVTPSLGAFDFSIRIESNDPGASPYEITVEGTGIPGNQPARADAAPGSTFAGASNGPFSVSLDPGQALLNADILLTDPESDNISVIAINAVGSVPVGIVEPMLPAPGHPITLSWTGIADAANAPGVYAWQVEFADAANGTPVMIDVVITIRDLEPEHSIADAEGGDGSPGNPYRASFQEGDGSTVRVDLAHISDPNTGQAVSVDSVSPAGLFQFNIVSDLLTVAPAATLAATDRGVHSIDVTVTDGSNFVTIAVSILVYGNSGAITFVTPSSLPVGVVNRAYNQLIEVHGATGAVVFDVVAGTLINGLSLGTDGRLSGTPTGTGTMTFTVRAMDSTSDTAARQFELTIRAESSGGSSGGGCVASRGHAAWVLLLLAAGMARRRRTARSP